MFHCKLLLEHYPYSKYCWISLLCKNSSSKNTVAHFFWTPPPPWNPRHTYAYGFDVQKKCNEVAKVAKINTV